MAKKLRFAAFTRVSTEKQEEHGESLRVQAEQIERAVGFMEDAKITKTYGGQEHGMPGWDKEQFNQLLADAQKKRKPFNAVIVARIDRWSRSPEENRKALRIMRDNGIRFFVGGTEHDLSKNSTEFFLMIGSEVGHYVAAEYADAALDSKIKRAIDGAPTTGSLPFGRTFDRKAFKRGTPAAECWGLR